MIRLLLLLTACVVLPACTSTEPTGPDESEDPPATPPPFTVDWVGQYTGQADGTLDGASTTSLPVTILIRFDQQAAADCTGCITIQFGEHFDRSGLLPQALTSGAWTYEDGDTFRSLRMEKFSVGGTPGTVFIGVVTVGNAPFGGPSPVVSLSFVVERLQTALTDPVAPEAGANSG